MEGTLNVTVAMAGGLQRKHVYPIKAGTTREFNDWMDRITGEIHDAFSGKLGGKVGHLHMKYPETIYNASNINYIEWKAEGTKEFETLS